MGKTTLVGIDLAKTSFHVHGADARGHKTFSRQVRRKHLVSTVDSLKPEIIAMEACGSAHYWGRIFNAKGFKVKLISPQHVKPFVKSQKNDRNDAEAISEAAVRPSMRFIGVKSVKQQDVLTLHRVKEGFKKQMLATSLQIRGLAAEYGVIFSKGKCKFDREVLQALELEENGLSLTLREALRDLWLSYISSHASLKKIEMQIKEIAKKCEHCRRLQKIPGIGPMTATAFVSAMGDPKQFRNGRHVAAWLGLVPRQYSTGGRSTLGGITKRGDDYLRYLLVQGGHSIVKVAKKKEDRFYKWVAQLHERRGTNVASVAVANRNARVMWSLMMNEENYRA